VIHRLCIINISNITYLKYELKSMWPQAYSIGYYVCFHR